jgi:hypothetical protein
MVKIKKLELQEKPFVVVFVDSDTPAKTAADLGNAPDDSVKLACTFEGETNIGKRKGLWAVVVVCNSEHPDMNLDTIAHECEHAKNLIMKRIGHPLRKWWDEPHAYLIGYLVGEASKFYGYGKLKEK